MAPDNIHANTKVHEVPDERNVPLDPEEAAKQLRMDELTALCKFMTQAVEIKTPHELIVLALRAILHQTTAKLAGYLGLDPEDPAPKIIMPEAAAVDIPLSKRLTAQAQKLGRTVWLFPTYRVASADRSLSAFADAICIPLSAPAAPSRRLRLPVGPCVH